MTKPSERQILEQRLSKYVSPKDVKKILSGNFPDVPMHNGDIHLVIVQVKDDDLSETTELIKSVLEIMVQNNFTIQSFLVSLVVSTSGFPPLREIKNPIQICRQTMKELTDKHPGKLKILYANIFGRFGEYGHPQRMTHGPLVPKFDLMLKQLIELNYGESAEYSPK